MRVIRSPFFRRLCLLLACAYAILAEPRVLWAAQQACGIVSAQGCGMADCPSRHGGACCCLLRQRMEAKYPGLRAMLDRLQAADRQAAQAPGCRLSARRCDAGASQAVPAAGQPHVLVTAPAALGAPSGQPSSAAPGLRHPRPDADPLLKVPLFS
jgi:hypothetical protein